MEGTIAEYLNGIANLFHIEFNKDEFHIVLQLKERYQIEKYYIEKYKGKLIEQNFIPESCYIFGTAMSNLQVSFVKYYNFSLKRKGVLMDGRYQRKLIESRDELEQVIKELKSGEYTLTGNISEEKKCNEREMEIGKGGRDKKEEESISDSNTSLFFNDLYGVEIKLRGSFGVPFKLTIIPPFLHQKIKEYRINYPCGSCYN